MGHVIAGIVILAIVMLAVMSQRYEGRWLAPGSFFALLWALYAGVSQAFVAQPERHLPGLLWILLSCGCVCAGAILGRAILQRKRNARGAAQRFTPFQSPVCAANPARISSGRTIRLPGFRTITVLLVLLGLGEIAHIFSRQGVSLQAIFDLTAVAQVSAANRVDFTYGDRKQSGLEWAVFVLVYTSTLFGGAYFRFTNSAIGKLLGLLTLVNSAAFGMLYGSRMGVLFGGSFWIGSFLAAHVLVSGRIRRSDLMFLLRVWGYSAAILLGLSIVTMAIRYRLLDAPRAMTRHLAETFVFVPAFCEWFREDGLTERDRLWGFRSFWKTYEILGVVAEPESAIPVENTSSNIFTVFRGLIDDFGPVGSCLALFAFGVISGGAYLLVQNGRLSMMPALVFGYAYTFLSTSFSLFTYNAPNVAMVLFALYFTLSTAGSVDDISQRESE